MATKSPIIRDVIVIAEFNILKASEELKMHGKNS